MEHFLFYFGYYFIASMSFCTGMLVGAAWRNLHIDGDNQ